MSIHQRNSTVTFKWTILPTGSPPVAADFDILLILPDFQGSYTDDNITSYVAPTATTQGQVTFDLALPQLGRYIVKLATGVSTAFIVRDTREIYAVDLPPHILLGAAGKLTQGPEIARRIITYDAIISNWGALGAIYGTGYDGDDTILFNLIPDADPQRIMSTNTSLATPQFAFNCSDLPSWPGGSAWIQFLEYSPPLGLWFIASWNGHMWWCEDDPLDVNNYTYIPQPTQWSGIGNSNISNIFWDTGLNYFHILTATNGEKESQISLDGKTLLRQAAYQDDFEDFSFQTYGDRGQYVVCAPFGGGGSPAVATVIGMEEAYRWKYDTNESLPASAQGWYVPDSNSGIVGSTTINHAAFDVPNGEKFVVKSRGYMNCTFSPQTWNSNWGPDGAANLGWKDQDMGLTGTNDATTVFWFDKQSSRPWKLFSEVDGWLDAADFSWHGGFPTALNAPQFAVCTEEPYATLHANFIADNFDRPYTVGTVGTNKGNYHIRYNEDSVYGTDGFLLANAGNAVNRDADYLIFRRASVIG